MEDAASQATRIAPEFARPERFSASAVACSSRRTSSAYHGVMAQIVRDLGPASPTSAARAERASARHGLPDESFERTVPRKGGRSAGSRTNRPAMRCRARSRRTRVWLGRLKSSATTKLREPQADEERVGLLFVLRLAWVVVAKCQRQVTPGTYCGSAVGASWCRKHRVSGHCGAGRRHDRAGTAAPVTTGCGVPAAVC